MVHNEKLNPLVSIIISTRNEENNVIPLIHSLKKQDYKNIEIIMIDNNSTDNTVKLASKHLNISNIKNISNHINLTQIKNFRGAQINYGVNISKGDIIFFPDADMTFDSELITEAVNKLQYFDALYIPEIVLGNGWFGKIRNFERSFYNMTCIDAIRIVKRDLFLKINGFDEYGILFGPDDWDLTLNLKRIGAKLGITNLNCYHHEEWLDFKTYVTKKQNYFKTFDDYRKKWGGNKDVIAQFSPWYRYVKVYLENGKWYKFISNPLLVFGLYFIRFTIGLCFLKNKLFPEKVKN